MKRKIELLGHLISILLLYYVATTIYKNAANLLPFHFTVLSIFGLLLAMILCVLSIAVTAKVWQVLIRGGGTDLRYRSALHIIGAAQIGKYFPGNVMQYAGRAALGAKAGISFEHMVFSIGVETSLVLTALVVLIATGMIVDPSLVSFMLKVIPERFAIRPNVMATVAFAIGIVAIIIYWCYRNKQMKHLKMLRLRVLVPAFGICVLNYLLYGIILWVIVNVVLPEPAQVSWYRLVWSFCIAWGAGFIVPGAPGGIGIRETVMIGILGPQIGAGNAAILAVLLRVVTTAGDAMAFGLARMIGVRRASAE